MSQTGYRHGPLLGLHRQILVFERLMHDKPIFRSHTTEWRGTVVTPANEMKSPISCRNPRRSFPGLLC